MYVRRGDHFSSERNGLTRVPSARQRGGRSADISEDVFIHCSQVSMTMNDHPFRPLSIFFPTLFCMRCLEFPVVANGSYKLFLSSSPLYSFPSTHHCMFAFLFVPNDCFVVLLLLLLPLFPFYTTFPLTCFSSAFTGRTPGRHSFSYLTPFVNNLRTHVYTCMQHTHSQYTRSSI